MISYRYICHEMFIKTRLKETVYLFMHILEALMHIVVEFMHISEAFMHIMVEFLLLIWLARPSY